MANIILSKPEISVTIDIGGHVYKRDGFIPASGKAVPPDILQYHLDILLLQLSTDILKDFK